MIPEFGRERLLAHRLGGDRLSTPAEVVRWLCGMQAQDYHQMLWALGSRMSGGSVKDVVNALDQGQIARCWAVRGTMHLVAGEDVEWMTALDAEKRMRADQRRLDQLGIVHGDIDRVAESTQRSLKGKGWVKRGDLMEEWERSGVGIAGQRGYHLLFHLAMRGLICIGPQVDKDQGIGLVTEQLPAQRRVWGDEARAEIALRYIKGHGPASIADLMWWSGWTKSEAQTAIDAIGESLDMAVQDGVTYWCDRAFSDPNSSVEGPLLVAGFDEFLLGYRDRSAVLDPAFAGRVVPGGNGIFQPFVVDQHQVVGLWKRTVRKHGVSIRLDPFNADSSLSTRARPEMERFAAFHGLSLE